jgi:thioredoxin 1
MKPSKRFLTVHYIACGLLSSSLLLTSFAGPDEGAGHSIAVTRGNIDSLLASEKPVLLDFGAVWCASCKLIAPEVEAIAEKYKGQVLVGRVDVDRETGLAQRYGVQGIPHLKILKAGKVVDQIDGYLSEAEIAKRLEKHLANS